MSTTNSITITPEQLRELHLNALQSLYSLDDQTIGAVEVILAVTLAHWDISYTAALMDLHNFISARKPGLRAHFSVGDEALAMIKALEEHNGTLAEKLAAAQKELAALRSTYANLSDILLQTESERDQITEELNTAKRENALLQYKVTEANKTIDELNARRQESILAAIDAQEAGTAAAANPPAPTPAPTATPPQSHAANLIAPVTPAPYSSNLARLAGEVDAAAAQFQATNSNGHNGSNGSNSKPHLVSHPAINLFPTTEMTRELQALVQALRAEQIEWKSLTNEQKKQLGIEVAAEILVQTGSAQTDLSRELFDSRKPTWMPTMHALCLGAPISASYLRASAATLAAARLHNQQASESPSRETSQAPSQETSQAPSRATDQEASQDASQDENQGSASNSDGSAPSSSD